MTSINRCPVNSMKVFIVDDNPDLVMLYTELLQHHECEVVDSASNGNEAVEKFSLFMIRPDLIIMDHQMPKKCGIEAAKEIFAIEPDARIVFISGDKHIETEVRRLGIDNFISKPFNTDTFSQLICNVCNGDWDIKCMKQKCVKEA